MLLQGHRAWRSLTQPQDLALGRGMAAPDLRTGRNPFAPQACRHPGLSLPGRHWGLCQAPEQPHHHSNVQKVLRHRTAPARHLGSARRHLSVCWDPVRAAEVWGRNSPCGSAPLQVDARLESQFSQHQHGFQTPQPWPLSLYTLQAVIIPLQKPMQTLEKENTLQALEQ